MRNYSTKKILLALIKVIVIIAVASSVFWIWLFARTYMSYSSFEKEKILIKNAIFLGYVADSEEKRAKGLSGKRFLPSNTAMLFEFDKPDDCGIWMKDMLFPIDIIWLDKNKMIINKVSNAEPSSYPKIFYPSQKCLYVLEVRAGLIKDKDLRLGDVVLFGKESEEIATTTAK